MIALRDRAFARSKDLEEKLIVLARIRAQRHPSILVQFVPPMVDGKVVHPERKCTCKPPLRSIALCYCFCDSDEGLRG